MNRVSLIAIKAHSYGGRFRQVGDTFTAPRSDARVLKALRKATDVGPVTETATYQTAALTPEPIIITAEPVVEYGEPSPDAGSEPRTEPFPAETERPKRRYRRRDLTAEDSGE